MSGLDTATWQALGLLLTLIVRPLVRGVSRWLSGSREDL